MTAARPNSRSASRASSSAVSGSSRLAMVAKSPCSGDVRNVQRSKHGSVADPVAVGHESASVVEPSAATVACHAGTSTAR